MSKMTRNEKRAKLIRLLSDKCKYADACLFKKKDARVCAQCRTVKEMADYILENFYKN